MFKTIVSSLTLIFLLLIPAIQTTAETLSVSRAVTLALENNPSIREARADIAAADESATSARADMLPTVSFHYSYSGLNEAPIMKQPGGSRLQIAHQQQYSWDITVIQPLFTGFALTSSLDMAGLEVTARELEKEQTVLDLIRNVKSACYQLMLVEKLLAVSNDEIRALRAHKRNAELFFNQGLVPANDVLKADVVLADTLQQREKLKADVQKVLIRLNRLLGRPLTSALVIEDSNTIADVRYDANALGRQALEKRPLIRLLDLGMQKLGLSQKLAKSAWYPQISLIGQYEQDGDNPGASENDYTNSYNSSITLQAEWKFWQSGKTRAEVRRTRREIESLKARIDTYRQQVLEEVRGGLLDCTVAHRNIDTASKSLEQAQENWRITQLQYQNQVATSADVLDARTFLTRADSNYFRALYGYLTAITELDRAVGKPPEM